MTMNRRSFLKFLSIVPFVPKVVEAVSEALPATLESAPSYAWKSSSIPLSIPRSCQTQLMGFPSGYHDLLIDNFFEPNPLWERLTTKKGVVLDGGSVITPIQYDRTLGGV